MKTTRKMRTVGKVWKRKTFLRMQSMLLSCRIKVEVDSRRIPMPQHRSLITINGIMFINVYDPSPLPSLSTCVCIHIINMFTWRPEKKMLAKKKPAKIDMMSSFLIAEETARPPGENWRFFFSFVSSSIFVDNICLRWLDEARWCARW